MISLAKTISESGFDDTELYEATIRYLREYSNLKKALCKVKLLEGQNDTKD